MKAPLKRGAGILLPISSLSSPYGIGTLGKDARKFIDRLHRAGQTYWQVLPVGPTSYGDSPYQSFSAFAGNPYFIDLDTLARDGLLTARELAAIPAGRRIGWITAGCSRRGSRCCAGRSGGSRTGTGRSRPIATRSATGWTITPSIWRSRSGSVTGNGCSGTRTSDWRRPDAVDAWRRELSGEYPVLAVLPIPV